MRLLELMDGYFTPPENVLDDMLAEGSGRYVSWQKVQSPERLIKDYSFVSRQGAIEFVRQLVLFEDQMNHHGKITLDHKEIRVEIFTHDINKVTEADLDYARVADQIYIDVVEYE